MTDEMTFNKRGQAFEISRRYISTRVHYSSEVAAYSIFITISFITMARFSCVVLASMILAFATIVNAFMTQKLSFTKSTKSSALKMAYLPEGFTQKQWDDLKKREEDEKKKKLGANGTTKFRSRSFEAWQKAGGKHLFPVDPLTTPYEERPYMQRKDGDWEGKDLIKRGMMGQGQGKAEKKLKLDEVYEDAKKAGKLNSISIFGGAALPWTNQATEDMNKDVSKAMQQARGVAGKKLSPQELARLKANLVKPTITPPKKNLTVATEETPKKKGLFGLF